MNQISCNTCTRRLVELAYQRSVLFRFFREPLKFLMRFWVTTRRINLNDYSYNNPNCLNCNRFYKNALKDNSRVFRWFNGLINPLFDKWMERIVGAAEIQKAKEHAKASLVGETPPEGWNNSNDLQRWNRI